MTVNKARANKYYHVTDNEEVNAWLADLIAGVDVYTLHITDANTCMSLCL